MGQKKKEKKIEDVKNDLPKFVDKETAYPCRNCRKRDSCFIQPREGWCGGFQEGIPWSVEFNKMCSNLPEALD